MPAPFRLYNTLSRQPEDFRPLQPGKVSLYVCGMTVYDHAHVGHARAFVTFDFIVRYLRHRGWDVTYVRNYTDIDDKIINRANEKGEDPQALADRFIAAWRSDAAGLGLTPPDHEPQVSHSIPEIIALAEALIERGHAYEQDGSVWFSVASDPDYGKLSGQKPEDLRNADVGNKRDSRDFALWKAAKPGEPSWPSPWGPGRPGWHIECSAMARKVLGDSFDIHGGGLDLVFPHHENEIAQSECGTGHPFATYWLHNGLLTMASGQKMGKSLGNVRNIHEVLEEFPAEALRLYYLQNHYRSPLPWGPEALPDALAMLARLYEAREVAEAMEGSEDPAQVIESLGADAKRVWELGNGFEAAFHAALDDDFNSSMALGHAFELARAINRFNNHKKAKKRGGPVVAPALASLSLLADGLGLLCLSSAEFQQQVKDKRLRAMGLSVDKVEDLIAQRTQARTDKDWARADALRGELTELGIVIMDRADGVDWRIRLSTDAE